MCGEKAEGETLFCSDEDGDVDPSMEKEIGREFLSYNTPFQCRYALGRSLGISQHENG